MGAGAGVASEAGAGGGGGRRGRGSCGWSGGRGRRACARSLILWASANAARMSGVPMLGSFADEVSFNALTNDAMASSRWPSWDAISPSSQVDLRARRLEHREVLQRASAGLQLLARGAELGLARTPRRGRAARFVDGVVRGRWRRRRPARRKRRQPATTAANVQTPATRRVRTHRRNVPERGVSYTRIRRRPRPARLSLPRRRRGRALRGRSRVSSAVIEGCASVPRCWAATCTQPVIDEASATRPANTNGLTIESPTQRSDRSASRAPRSADAPAREFMTVALFHPGYPWLKRPAILDRARSSRLLMGPRLSTANPARPRRVFAACVMLRAQA